MPEQGASFIPKSGVRTVRRTGSARRVYILAYISYIVFFTTLFVVIGVYLYSASVNRTLSGLKEQLNAERQRFAVADIDRIRSLDLRLRTASRLLEESSAPSRIFSDIEKIVASNIYFTSMSYKVLPNRQFQIDLVGRANNFNQVLSQRDLLRDSQVLDEAVVSSYDYSVASEGGSNNGVFGNTTLAFTFSDTRDLSLISYKVNETESVVITPVVETAAVSTTTAPATSTSTASDENVVASPATPGAAATSSGSGANEADTP